MSNVRVSYQEIETAAHTLRTGQSEILDKLRAMHQHIQNLVSSGFVTDKASGAYRDSFEKFTGGAQQTLEALNELAQFLQGTSAALQELDTQLASRLR
ncbi:WXG100 family type VII secretion target [Lysinibacter sp. HNR]|uniref:WXG100 family type VII secretion target n=1 Tax=Lysinibacter sp. HNR TaxID=3031408 RepID=UPI0024360194|nr:WXG100 family type VII secretion target [Lysinibacter sp. HNR]WGD36430.1 WXG100 family type VII secretion target [Lysinibacter sp. HNR]